MRKHRVEAASVDVFVSYLLLHQLKAQHTHTHTSMVVDTVHLYHVQGVIDYSSNAEYIKNSTIEISYKVLHT
jgi:hypothetical protein